MKCRCGGRFEHFVIRAHNYSFMRCDRCFKFLGRSEVVRKEIDRLMAIKVRPRIEKW